jgi:hypothetical protein
MRRVALLAILAAIAGCATPTPEMVAASLGPIEAAATVDPAVLRAQAETGGAQAQYALSIVLEHGLQGFPEDRQAAGSYRRKATAARGFTPITTYIAGLNGAPGRVAIINTPRYEFSAVQAVLVERCVEALEGSVERPTPADDCGGPAVYGRLLGLWRQSKLR